MSPLGEVVNLISSSPKPHSPPLHKRPLFNDNSAFRAKSIFDIDDDGWSFGKLSDPPDFPVPDLVKRRKLSLETSQVSQLSGSAGKPLNLSDDENLPPVKQSQNISANVRSVAFGAKLRVSDEIEFTSPAPEARRDRTGGAAVALDLSDDSDLELPDDIFNHSLPSLSRPPSDPKKGVFSERTTNLLANLNSKLSRGVGESSKNKFRQLGSTTSRSVLHATVGDIGDVFSASQEDDIGTKSKKSKLSEQERHRKAAERAASKAAKEKEKEAEKAQKQLAKEQKALEKQKAADIAEVNKSKIDKNASVKEMILEMPRSLEKTSIGNQIEAFIEKLEANVNYCDGELDLSDGNGTGPESVGNVIKWRRKVESFYNPEVDLFQPLAQKRIEKEKHVLIHITGTEFATLAARQPDGSVAHISEAAMKANLDAHVHAIKRKHKGCTPLYLIEGLDALLRKNKNAKNRDYQAAARRTHIAFFTADLTDGLLLHLQLTHSPEILIHHTPTPAQSAHWITVFTSHLSTRPYRLQRNAFNDAHAGFCIDTGQVKTASDSADAFVMMLQALPRVTASMGVGIREAGWASVGELVRGFRSEGRLMLEDVRKAVNRDGGVSEKRVGQAVSKRLWKLFMGVDPAEVNI